MHANLTACTRDGRPTSGRRARAGARAKRSTGTLRFPAPIHGYTTTRTLTLGQPCAEEDGGHERLAEDLDVPEMLPTSARAGSPSSGLRSLYAPPDACHGELKQACQRILGTSESPQGCVAAREAGNRARRNDFSRYVLKAAALGVLTSNRHGPCSNATTEGGPVRAAEGG